jgi:hypothetical protein
MGAHIHPRENGLRGLGRTDGQPGVVDVWGFPTTRGEIRLGSGRPDADLPGAALGPEPAEGGTAT